MPCFNLYTVTVTFYVKDIKVMNIHKEISISGSIVRLQFIQTSEKIQYFAWKKKVRIFFYNTPCKRIKRGMFLGIRRENMKIRSLKDLEGSLSVMAGFIRFHEDWRKAWQSVGRCWVGSTAFAYCHCVGYTAWETIYE